jgi:uncharacterized protein YqeY
MEVTPDPIRLRLRLRESLKVALSARDGIAASAIRSAMAAIDNAGALDAGRTPVPTGGAMRPVHLGVGAADVPRRELSAHEVIEIVRHEVHDRQAAAAEYERLGRAEKAGRLTAEAKALASFLETALEETA